MHDATETSVTGDDTGQPQPTAATFPLLAHLNALLEELRARVPAALGEWEPEAIHQSRVATRRLKAALDLMKPVLSKRPRRKIGRILRRLRRRLGPLRDADVMIDHLQDLGESSAQHAPAAAWLARRLGEERDSLRLKTSKGKRPATVIAKLDAWEPVRGEIETAREALDSLLAESLHLQLDAFAEQADRLCEPADDQPATGDERQDPHELRISGKALRYTLEMAAAHGHELPGSLTKTFKKMQDALGDWHDYVVLAEHATSAAIEDQLAHHAPDLMRDLFELVRDILEKSKHELDDFRQRWREEGDSVAKAIRLAFPLTRAASAVSSSSGGGGNGAATDDANVSRRRTDRDPGGSAPPATSEGAPPAAAGDV
jgi:CHAD domain-containing protein